MTTTKIPALLTVYNRLERLPHTLDQLKNQVLEPDTEIDLIIINNNFDKVEEVDKIVNDSGIKCKVIHNMINFASLQRWLYLKDTSYDYVIILDDDLEIANYAIQSLYNARAPKTLISAVVLSFRASYHNAVRVGEGGMGKLACVGCCIADISFLRDNEFWSQWKPWYFMTDDSWISWYTSKFLGYTFIQRDLGLKLLKLNDPKIGMVYNRDIRNLQNSFWSQHS